jgi:hypothetical protein
MASFGLAVCFTVSASFDEYETCQIIAPDLKIHVLQWGVTNHRYFIVTVLNFLYKMLSPRVEAWGQAVVKGIRLQNLGRDGKQIPLNRNHQDTPVSYVPPVFFYVHVAGGLGHLLTSLWHSHSYTKVQLLFLLPIKL